MSAESASRDDEQANLLPAKWAELQPLVDAALDVALELREARIIQMAAGDVTKAAAIRALVADCEKVEPLLEVSAPERFAHLLETEQDQPLPDILGDRYRIERELGRGGMARVFLALDTKHNRRVAVKVIRPDLAASLGRDRFLREIGIAARLRHPNIVPMYDSGDADGVLYFVMPYEDGLSLRQRMDQHGALPATEYVSVLRDVARALAYAHEQGVVHRDVKPDNVMLSGRAAVVTDFGIAKAVSVAQGTSGNTTALTQSGSGIGTPTYMAPEQAVGDPGTDHRADIYSFGCLAYELISGKPPFHDMPVHQLVAAHVAIAPAPITGAQSSVAAPIASLVMQCLAKEPADRPQSAKMLLDALDASTTNSQPAASQPEPVVREAGRAGMRRAIPVAIAAAVVALGGAGFLLRRAATPVVEDDVTVAVLPLQITGGDTLQRALAEGLSDEVATELFKVPGVHVMSRRGVANYRNQRELDTDKLGRELGARFLVMGTLREIEGRLRVLASLVRASDGAVLWTDRFDRAQLELGAVRSDIARAVGDTLSRLVPRSAAQLASASPADLRRSKGAVSPEAYRLYVLAQRALDRRGLSMQSSIDNFEQATKLDSNYAEAWAGLSLARALMPYFSPLSAPAIEPVVRAAATRALALDSTLSAAHVALGLVHQHAYQWDSAATEYQTAVRWRRDGDLEPYIQYGRHLLFRGRVRDGMQQFMLARRSEPASALVSAWVSYAYYLDGQLDSALAESRRAYQSDSMNTTMLTHGMLIRQSLGLTAESRRFANRTPFLNPVGLYVFSLQGDSAMALARLRQAALSKPPPSGLSMARASVLLGAQDTAGALAALKKATDDHEIWASYQAVLDPIYAPLWPSARYAALLRRVGLGDVVLPSAKKN